MTSPLTRPKLQKTIKHLTLSVSPPDRTIPAQGNTAEIQLTVLHRNFLGVDEFLGQTRVTLSDQDVYERPRNRSGSLHRGTGPGHCRGQGHCGMAAQEHVIFTAQGNRSGTLQGARSGSLRGRPRNRSGSLQGGRPKSTGVAQEQVRVTAGGEVIHVDMERVERGSDGRKGAGRAPGIGRGGEQRTARTRSHGNRAGAGRLVILHEGCTTRPRRLATSGHIDPIDPIDPYSNTS